MRSIKHKQKTSHRSWPTTFQRVKHKIERPRRAIQQPAQASCQLQSNRFLSITFENIPYLSVFKQGKVGAKELVSVARQCASALVADIEGAADYNTLMKFTTRFDEIAKECECEWFVGEVDGLPAIVFYHDLGALGGWIPIRINFLSKLRRRSKNWYDTVLNCFRHMTKKLLFDDATNVHYALEGIEEQMEEWEDEYDEEFVKKRMRIRQLLHSYREGKIRKEMGTVLQEPEISIDECISRLEKLPIDLVKLKIAIGEVLELAKSGKNLANYDLKYGSGINEVEQFDDYYISIDRQFNWVYDYDWVCDQMEEALDADYSGGGEQPLTNWRILAENFTKPKSLKAFTEELEGLKEDQFPAAFDEACGHLCRTINELFPTKHN